MRNARESMRLRNREIRGRRQAGLAKSRAYYARLRQA